MSGESSIWTGIAEAVNLFFHPLRQASQQGPNAIEDLVEEALGARNARTAAALATLADRVVTFSSDVSEIESLEDLRAASSTLKAALDTVSATIGVDALVFLEYLTVQFLWNFSPRSASILAILEVLDETNAPGQRLNWGNLAYLGKPRDLLRQVYHWGEEGFSARLLLARIADAAAAFNSPVSYVSAREDAQALIDAGTLGSSRPLGLAVPLLNKIVGSKYISAGFTAIPISGGSRLSDAGIAVVPFGVAAFPAEPLGSGWAISFGARGGEGRGVAIRPSGITPISLPQASASEGRISAVIARTAGQPWRQSFGGIFNLSASAISLTVGADVGTGPAFDAKLRVDDFEIRLVPGTSDGFLSELLPPEGIAARSDFSVEWSAEQGVTFSASAGLSTSVPLHLLLGPVSLDTLHLAAEFDGALVKVEGLLDLSGSLGPVAASVSKMGVRVEFTLDDATASEPRFDRLGPVGVKIGAVAPAGVGLAVMADPVTGGGFLRHDETLGQYAGILNLQFSEIGLVAVALITTKLPGGKPGYALFINIGVTFSPPITLPYNFNLAGCGGLLALNRTMDVEELRKGLKARTLDSILFPEDPIVNANKIINDSERVFPIEEGRFVVGPMAKLGWGANGLIVADVAIVIEFPAPIIIALLGQITAKFPKADQAKVVLHLDVLGVLDIAKKSLSIDATLYDSRILTYDLSGDSALRLSWGSKPVFALSLGGFHPKFSPPPKFPKLRRLTLQLSSSDSLELSCSVYQALTSNALMFGANLRLHAEACGVDADGRLTFDSLIIFSPFEFEIGIDGSVSVSYRGHDVSSVRLSLDLSGPTPWHAKGKAKFSVLTWDVTARFSKTWGSQKRASLPKVDPRPPFLEEIKNISNWNAAILPRRTAVESLKSAEAGVPQPVLLVHPAGMLEVRQRLLPLKMHLDKFANAEVKNNFEFDFAVALAATGSPTVERDYVEEHFARGQFKSLSKAERLSKPSYEKFKAGIRVGPNAPRLDGLVQPCDLEFESILIRADGSKEPPTNPNPKAKWSQLRRTFGVAAFRRASLRRRNLGKYSNPGAARVGVEDERYTIVDALTLTCATAVLPISGDPLTQTEAEDRVDAAVSAGVIASGSVMVVPDFEEELV